MSLNSSRNTICGDSCLVQKSQIAHSSPAPRFQLSSFFPILYFFLGQAMHNAPPPLQSVCSVLFSFSHWTSLHQTSHKWKALPFLYGDSPCTAVNHLVKDGVNANKMVKEVCVGLQQCRVNWWGPTFHFLASCHLSARNYSLLQPARTRISGTERTHVKHCYWRLSS